MREEQVDEIVALLREFVESAFINTWDSTLCWGCGEIKRSVVNQAREKGQDVTGVSGDCLPDCLLLRTRSALREAGIAFKDWGQNP